MKKIIILSLCFMLSDFCAPAFAQETLSLQECREMALKYNKEMAASIKQTESTHYTAKVTKGTSSPILQPAAPDFTVMPTEVTG